MASNFSQYVMTYCEKLTCLLTISVVDDADKTVTCHNIIISYDNNMRRNDKTEVSWDTCSHSAETENVVEPVELIAEMMMMMMMMLLLL